MLHLSTSIPLPSLTWYQSLQCSNQRFAVHTLQASWHFRSGARGKLCVFIKHEVISSSVFSHLCRGKTATFSASEGEASVFASAGRVPEENLQFFFLLCKKLQQCFQTCNASVQQCFQPLGAAKPSCFASAGCEQRSRRVWHAKQRFSAAKSASETGCPALFSARESGPNPVCL